MYVVSVALNIPLRLCYQYSSEFEIAVGTRVIVELKNKNVIGVVVGIEKIVASTQSPQMKLKPILAKSDECYNLNPHTVSLLQFVSNYYHYPLGQTIFTAIPKKLKDIKFLGYEEKYFRTKIKTNLGVANSNKHELNEQQRNAVKQVCLQPSKFNTFLLHGITGSGKTEVYLHIIEFYLQLGKQILVLIPEINLTPQLLSRFSSRFGLEQIFALNSSVTDLNRCKAWLLASVGVAKIIISTRLGVFTPFVDLGLVIVDEEHDKSFKQNDHLRYQARDIAIWRAKYHNIPIVLGSATPAIESFYNAQQHKYSYLFLANRAVKGAVLSDVTIVDTEQNPVNDSGISLSALKQIEDCLKREEICLVFINKRGYAPVLKCNCGWTPDCKNCSAKMVCHLTVLKCHHCSLTQDIPYKCPKCHQEYLYTVGYGTQKVEEFLSGYFKDKDVKASILRIDRDTTTLKGSWDDIYDKVNKGEVNLLVGTQMLAKGHDFPNLTLVVVIDSDYLLYSSNFRAHEDLFSTTLQIAGRSGRSSKRGKVLIQTQIPEHPIYKTIKQHSYREFATQELEERKLYELPPFEYYAVLRIHSYKHVELSNIIKKVNKLFDKYKPYQGIDISKAKPNQLLKLNKQFRGNAVIMSKSRDLLHKYLSKIEGELTKISTNIIIDVDPVE